MPRKIKKKPLFDRFMKRVSPEPNSGCWLWFGSGTNDGYGQIGIDGRNHLAHRISFELHYGKISPDTKVLHSCDLPCCVNPEHLFLGTQADNMADMVKKKRHARLRGEAHGRAKLTDDDVRTIRRFSGRTHAAIAADFGVSDVLVSQILSGKIWSHITA